MMAKLLGRVPVIRLIRVACYLAIVALGLMVWSVLVPAALPVVLGMSVGQGIGVIAFVCFGLAVLADTQRVSGLAPLSVSSPPAAPPEDTPAPPDDAPAPPEDTPAPPDDTPDEPPSEPRGEV